MSQIGYMAQVLVLWFLVFVCEKSFRATILNVIEELEQ